MRHKSLKLIITAALLSLSACSKGGAPAQLSGFPGLTQTPAEKPVRNRGGPSTDGLKGSDFSGSLKCLKPFVLIDENDNAGLRAFLEANPACLDTGTYEERNYFTFAIEKDSIEALKILLTVTSDAKKQARVYDLDKRSKSVFTMIRQNPAENSDLPRILYDIGLRRQTSTSGDNLADLAWPARDGALVADLFLNDQVKANGKSQYDYLAHAAEEDFAGFIRAYADRKGLDLQAKYKYNVDRPETLLEISLDGYKFKPGAADFSVLSFYIEKKAVLKGDRIDESVLQSLANLRFMLASDPKKCIALDLAHLRMARELPSAWAIFADNFSGKNSLIEYLLQSIVKNKSAPPLEAVATLFTSLPQAKIYSPVDMMAFEAKGDDAEALLAAFAAKNRFPTFAGIETLTQGKVGEFEKARAAYSLLTTGLSKGLYPSPVCRNFFKGSSPFVVIPVVEGLVAAGMDPKTCTGVTDSLMSSTWPFAFELFYFFAKLSGETPDRLLKFTVEENVEVKRPIAEKYGFVPKVAEFLQRPENSRLNGKLCENLYWGKTNGNVVKELTRLYNVKIEECIAAVADIAWRELSPLTFFSLEPAIASRVLKAKNMESKLCAASPKGTPLDSLTETYSLDPVKCWQGATSVGVFSKALLDKYPEVKEYVAANPGSVQAHCANPDNEAYKAIMTLDEPVSSACFLGVLEMPPARFEKLFLYNLSKTAPEALVEKLLFDTDGKSEAYLSNRAYLLTNLTRESKTHYAFPLFEAMWRPKNPQQLVQKTFAHLEKEYAAKRCRALDAELPKEKYPFLCQTVWALRPADQPFTYQLYLEDTGPTLEAMVREHLRQLELPGKPAELKRVQAVFLTQIAHTRMRQFQTDDVQIPYENFFQTVFTLVRGNSELEAKTRKEYAAGLVRSGTLKWADANLDALDINFVHAFLNNSSDRGCKFDLLEPWRRLDNACRVAELFTNANASARVAELFASRASKESSTCLRNMIYTIRQFKCPVDTIVPTLGSRATARYLPEMFNRGIRCSETVTFRRGQGTHAVTLRIERQGNGPSLDHQASKAIIEVQTTGEPLKTFESRSYSYFSYDVEKGGEYTFPENPNHTNYFPEVWVRGSDDIKVRLGLKNMESSYHDFNFKNCQLTP